MKLTEYVVNGLITFLEANLPTKLAELQAEYNDGIILDPIKGYYISEKKDVPEFPAIFVIDDETDFPDQRNDYVVGIHRLLVVVAVTDQNEDNLTHKLWRYRRAIAEVVNQDNTLGIGALKADFGRFFPTPMFTDKSATFMKDSYMQVEVWTQEV